MDSRNDLKNLPLLLRNHPFSDEHLRSMGKVTGKVMPFWPIFMKLDRCKPLKTWYRGWESNPHAPYGAQDFKSCASASSATPAQNASRSLAGLTTNVIRCVAVFLTGAKANSCTGGICRCGPAPSGPPA
jgi:hypothetical protein